MTNEELKQLFSNYFAGKLSTSELKQLKNEMQNISDEVLWEMLEENESTHSVEKMTAEERELLYQQIERTIRMRKRRTWILSAACFLCLFVGLASLFKSYENRLQKHSNYYTSVRILKGNKAAFTLPDGTHLEVNGGTALRYSIIPGVERHIKLDSGEVYFNVAKNPLCPFVVSMKDMDVEVLGTQFNLKVSEKTIETALFSGSVKLTSPHLKNECHLVPGQKTIYNKVESKLSWQEADLLCDAGWRNGTLVFKDTPLKEVFEDVSNAYGVEFHLQRNIPMNDKITGTFKQTGITEMLDALSRLYNFSYSIKEKQVYIK